MERGSLEHLHRQFVLSSQADPWLSAPIVAASPLFVVLIAWAVTGRAVAPLLALVPAASVLPFLLWLNRVQPEPLPARVHAFLWGRGSGHVAGVDHQ